MDESLKGQFLVAARSLKDPNFFKTVVLMVEHGENGAMGVVINRPSAVTVTQALSEHFDLPERDEVVYVGGPVEPRGLFILHDQPDIDDETEPIVDGVHVGGNAAAFERIVSSMMEGTNELDLQFRIFSGCAGWGPDQLEGELERGDWYLLPGTSSRVFCVEPYSIWDDAIDDIVDLNRILPDAETDPRWN